MHDTPLSYMLLTERQGKDCMGVEAEQHHDSAEVARSMTRGPWAEGHATAIGLVPKTASVEPWGATYSGLWHRIAPT